MDPRVEEKPEERPAAVRARTKPRSRRVRMASAHPEVLDAEGAARVLGVSQWLVLRLAREGKLPGKKVGKEWRFRLTNLLRWLGESDGLGAGDRSLQELLKHQKVKLLPKARA